MLDIRGIVTYSSNIGMGMIAQRMGNEVLHDTLRRFGLGQRTGVGLPGESGGVVYQLRRWTSYSTTSVPMGYEVLVTPLQLVTAFAAIVNDGILLKPKIVKKLLGPSGEIIESFETPQIVRRVVSSQVARFVSRDLLVSVVENGGGRRAKVGPYRVLGKTGTAKLTYPDRSGYEPGAYQSTFVGAAPVAHPQAVVAVLVRRPNPSLGYYGSTVAAPIVGEILAETLSYLQVEPEARVTLKEL
jgi:cell division protein FtsI/penicillin-binding protein 2